MGKKVPKNKVIQNRQQQHIMNERAVMATLSADDGHADSLRCGSFCCKLMALYQDPLYLYFVMEPLLGGELFTLLRYNGKFSEKICRFYISCIVLAFAHLHSL